MTYLGINAKGQRVYHTTYIQAAANFAKFYGVSYEEFYYVTYSYTVTI